MALTAITTLNIPGITQNIVFNNPTQVDEIDFGSNQITLKAIASFNLSKSDFLLYSQYLNVYYTALLLNFSNINSSVNQPIPASKFNIKPQQPTVLLYEQLSGATSAIVINYNLVTKVATFTARVSDVVITLQEFFLAMNMIKQFTAQVSLQ